MALLTPANLAISSTAPRHSVHGKFVERGLQDLVFGWFGFYFHGHMALLTDYLVNIIPIVFLCQGFGRMNFGFANVL